MTSPEPRAGADDRADAFERLRPRLFGVAYRMLASVEDADDVLQEAYLRWHRADPAAVRSAEAWLVAVVTRASIDRLRRAETERAAYVGRWLPEPIAGARVPPPDASTELASELSLAFLVLLERLAPEERAAFLLREVFGASYAEIAAVLGRKEGACRQVVHRARERVRRPERRFPAPADAKQRLLERFLGALAADDRDALVALLTEDAVLVGDGGGKAPAVRDVVAGRDRVADLLLAFERKSRGVVTHAPAWINAEPAVLTLAGGLTAFTTSFEVRGGHIAAVYRVLNPDKLRHVGPAPYLHSRPLPRPGGAPPAVDR